MPEVLFGYCSVYALWHIEGLWKGAEADSMGTLKFSVSKQSEIYAYMLSF